MARPRKSRPQDITAPSEVSVDLSLALPLVSTVTVADLDIKVEAALSKKG